MPYFTVFAGRPGEPRRATSPGRSARANGAGRRKSPSPRQSCRRPACARPWRRCSGTCCATQAWARRCRPWPAPPGSLPPALHAAGSAGAGPDACSTASMRTSWSWAASALVATRMTTKRTRTSSARAAFCLFQIGDLRQRKEVSAHARGCQPASTSSSSRASRAAWVRLVVPSLRKMWRRCTFTVVSQIVSS